MIAPLNTAGFWNQVFVCVGCPIRLKDGDYITSEVGALCAKALWCLCNNVDWSEGMEVITDEFLYKEEKHEPQPL